MSDRTYVFRLRGDNGDLVTATESAGASIDRLGAKTTELGAKSVAADKQSAAARGALADQTRRTVQQNQQLGYQLNDFFVQVQAGQSPLTALIQQGSQLSGTFGGIGAATKAVLGLLTPTVLALGGLAAVAGVVGYGFVQGRRETEAWNKSLLLTGNYAAQSAASIEVLSKKISDSTRATQGQAREAIVALAGTGEIGPRLIAPLADAMVRVQRTSGQTTEQLTKDFAQLTEQPSKFAAEHNKAWNFISGDQYAYLKRLEEQGQKEQAALEVAKLVSAHFSGPLADSLYKVGDLSKGVANDFASLMNWLRRLGAETTAEERLGEIAKQLRELDRLERARRNLPAFSSAPPLRESGQRAGLEAEASELQRDEYYKKQHDLEIAESKRAEKSRIAAIDARDHWREETKGISQVNRELEKYRKLTVEPLKGTANEISAAEIAATEAAIREKYKTRGDKAAEQLDNRFSERRVALQQEGAKLDAEIKSWELYGRSVDKARVAVLDLEIAQGKLKGLSAAKIDELRKLAGADDEKDRRLDQAKIEAGAAKRIELLRAEANAKAGNAREGEIARRIAAEEAAGLQVGTAAYIEQAAQIRTWVGVKYDGMLATKLAADAAETDATVAKLDAETRSLGLSTIERQKNVSVIRLQAEAERDILANPGKRAEILETLTRNTDALTAAQQRNYDASRTAEVGIAAAFQRYGEEAANAASFSERVVGGSLSRLEDALTEFATTGKLKLGGLFKFMADEFIRNWVRMQIAQQSQSGSGLMSFFQSIAGLFGAGGVNVDTSGVGIAEGGYTGRAGTSGGRALGGDVGAGKAVLVGEHGPEALLMGRQGGRVLSNSALKAAGRSSAGNGNVFVTNIGTNARVSSAEQDDDGHWHLVLEQIVERAANLGAQRGHAMVAADFASGSGQASRGLKSRGVSLNGALAKRHGA